MNLRCLIIDDEPNAVLLLESYISRLPYLTLQKSCYDGVEALEFLKDNIIDVVFLDINIPLMNGMELSPLLPVNTRIIFTTAYSEYAVQSYERNAVDYLLKPITFIRFTSAIQKVLALQRSDAPHENKITPQVDWLYVKTGPEFVRLEYDDILFIKGEKEYIAIHTITNRYMIYKRMKEVENQLPQNFCRVHQSFIVNMKKIKKVAQNQITIGKEVIPISQTYRNFFLEEITHYLL